MPRKLLIAVALTWVPILALVLATLSTPDTHPSAEASLASPASAPDHIHKGVPRVVVEQVEFQVGHMDFDENGQRNFSVKNDGEAPLYLRADPVLSPALKVDIPSEAIQPGNEGVILVAWRTGRAAGEFTETVQIHTNDPEQRTVALTIRGDVRAGLAVEPAELNFGDVRPDVGAETETIVFSNVWDRFSIVKVESNLAPLTWQIQPASEEIRSRLRAKSAYQVKIQVPPDMDHGKLLAQLTFHIAPDGEPVVVREVNVTGRVLRRLSVYGDAINRIGVLDLGVTHVGREQKTRVLLKVRDPQTELPVRKITTRPEFLSVQMTPTGMPGDYYMDVVIPRTATPADHTNLDLGQIRVEFDHPRIPSLELKAHFTVTTVSPFYESPFLDRAPE